MSRGLRMSRALHEDILAHCRSAYPKEACGLLAGDAAPSAGREGWAVQVYPMTNVENSPIGYAMEPKEQLLVEKQMRSRNQRMLGIYHSHTASEAYPSSVDVGLAAYPEVSYVLVSLKDRARPQTKSYRIQEGTVIPEDLQVRD